MRVIIREGVPGDAMDAVLPTAFKGRLPRSVTGSLESFTFVLFPGMTHARVVRSSALQKALARVPADVRIVAVANQFTTEAHQELEQRDAVIVSLKEVFWTEESLDRSRRR